MAARAAMDIAIATCMRLPEPDRDEPLLEAALAGEGLKARLAAWDDPEATFHDARMVLLRSTWNYPSHWQEFLRWVALCGGRLVNCQAVVKWNIHKAYLQELEAAGLRVVPTVFVPRGDKKDLSSVARAEGWNTVVLKPAISAASRLTRRVELERERADDAQFFADLVGSHDAMVQPYVRSVEEYGERAVVWIDGEVTHAVRKSPRFCGQDESVSEALPVAPDELQTARRAMEVARGVAGSGALIYGRVDVARDDAGRCMIMELELIEPSLFFVQEPRALARFVRAVRRTLATLGQPRVDTG